MNSASIHCPHCGAALEIQARPVQTELPLGPMICSPAKNNLDRPAPSVTKIERVASTTANLLLSDKERVKRVPEYPSLPAPNVATEYPLLEELLKFLPPSEMLRNGGLWRTRIRESPRAVAYAIEDFKLRTPEQRRQIRNVPGWLTDRYTRALAARKIA